MTLANPKNARAFVLAWKAEPNQCRARRALEKTAKEQAKNLEKATTYGAWLADYGLTIADYEDSVRLLQNAIA